MQKYLFKNPEAEAKMKQESFNYFALHLDKWMNENGTGPRALDRYETTKEIQSFIDKNLPYAKSEFKRRLLKRQNISRQTEQTKRGGRFVSEDLEKLVPQELTELESALSQYKLLHPSGFPNTSKTCFEWMGILGYTIGPRTRPRRKTSGEEERPGKLPKNAEALVAFLEKFGNEWTDSHASDFVQFMEWKKTLEKKYVISFTHYSQTHVTQNIQMISPSQSPANETQVQDETASNQETLVENSPNSSENHAEDVDTDKQRPRKRGSEPRRARSSKNKKSK